VAYLFEWDAEKAAANIVKHAVGFSEACTVFEDLRAVVLADTRHSGVEARFLSLGRSSHHRLLVVCYTDRPPATRIISARRASRRERRHYETHGFEDPPAR
jgi:uncharacterized DUF497 family protein